MLSYALSMFLTFIGHCRSPAQVLFIDIEDYVQLDCVEQVRKPLSFSTLND
jgi:hypothetical protein